MTQNILNNEDTRLPQTEYRKKRRGNRWKKRRGNRWKKRLVTENDCFEITYESSFVVKHELCKVRKVRYRLNYPSRTFFLMRLTFLRILSRMSRDQDTSWCKTWGILASSSAWTSWFHCLSFLPKRLLFVSKRLSFLVKHVWSAWVKQ